MPEGTQADVDRAVAAAKAAFPGWRDTTPGERAPALLKLADLLEEHGEELCALESANVGKPMAVAREEMPVTVDNLRFFAGAARTLEGRAAGEYMAGYTSMVRREPIGVVGQIAPWNYPLMMAIWKIGPALATGNTIVLKPSELTPLTRAAARRAGGGGAPARRAQRDHRRRRAGRRRARAPSRRAARLAHRLAWRPASGSRARPPTRSSACTSSSAARRRWSCSTTPIPAAVAEALKVAGYYNSGQDCTAATRILAAPGVHDELLDAIVPAVESLKVGDPAEADDLDMGPVVSAEQQERVLGFLERARRRRRPGADRRRHAARARRVRGADRASPASASATRSCRTRSSARS